MGVGEVVVVVCVCWATTLARSPAADSALAQPAQPRFDSAKAQDAAFRTSAWRRANSRNVMAI